MYQKTTGLIRSSIYLISTILAMASQGIVGQTVINELMASNSTTIADSTGQYDDWIELYNPGTTPVDLAGMYISDDLEELTKWRFPLDRPSLTVIPPGGFLIVWTDGDIDQEGLHANFRLNASGELVVLTAPDGRTILDIVRFDSIPSDLAYGRYPDGADQWATLTAATPGAPNQEPYQEVLATPQFSHERGFFWESFDLEIWYQTPDAFIFYTTDGSMPIDSKTGKVLGQLYKGPIHITGTTCVRAIAYKPFCRPSSIQTHTYIFPQQVIRQPDRPPGFPATWAGFPADYQMDPDITNDPRYAPLLEQALLSLPTMSVVMNTDDLFGPSGIYSNPTNRGPAWERPASVELIWPDGRPGFQIDCGIQIQGGWFRPLANTPKKSFRLVFKGIYGPSKLRYDLFGNGAVKEFDTITLRAGANDGYSWHGARYTEQYTRDEFGRQLQRATGHPSSHGMFVHLYLNGLYWGLYNPCERPDASFCASYYGGQKEDWDSLHNGGSTEVIEGDMEAWNQMIQLCRQGLTSNAAYQRLQGNNPDGTRNPTYPCLLDVDNYIDYLIVNIWGGNWDWPWKNWYAARKRTADSTGFKFFCWDYENTMGNNLARSPLNKNALQNNFSSAGEPHQYLSQNPEYRLRFADQVHRLLLNDGPLTPSSLIDRYQRLSCQVELAIICESARWGDQHHHPPLTLEDWYDADQNYNDGRAGRGWILNYYLPQRTGIVLQQLRQAGLYPPIDAPVFHINGLYKHGGQVDIGDLLAMVLPEGNSGTIYFTMDGSDPRQCSSDGQMELFIIVPAEAPKLVLVPTGPVDQAWTGTGPFDDSAWILTSGRPGGVGFDKLPSSGGDYRPFISLDLASAMATSATVYIRIPFTVSQATLDRIAFLGLRILFDDGFVAYINGNEVQRANLDGVPTWNSRASVTGVNAGSEPMLLDMSQWIGLLRAGQNVLAIQGLNSSAASNDLLIWVELIAANSSQALGVSVAAQRYQGPIPLTSSCQVKARLLSGSIWSALNQATYAVGPILNSLRISEIMYHAQDPNLEFIELVNIGTQPIDLNLVRLTQGVRFAFGQTVLPPEGYVVVVKDMAAFTRVYGQGLPVAGVYYGSLNNAGERIRLEDPLGQVILDFEYKDSWYPATDGQGYSLVLADPWTAEPRLFGNKALWRPSTRQGGSPGWGG